MYIGNLICDHNVKPYRSYRVQYLQNGTLRSTRFSHLEDIQDLRDVFGDFCREAGIPENSASSVHPSHPILLIEPDWSKETLRDTLEQVVQQEPSENFYIAFLANKDDKYDELMHTLKHNPSYHVKRNEYNACPWKLYDVETDTLESHSTNLDGIVEALYLRFHPSLPDLDTDSESEEFLP